ncbi:helix-turn-helix transcriptional regulator [Olsenella uli]|jgi:transcriptional regulator with XRE-family HTH domain|uniref:helix-turn-helix domain-containing protein n=1 Tax=Thermophilibacter provencensis TaxID=1852386 RepID=UPI00094B390F|nr:helix-turn-helix transcriptional regulator [Thermophilibacter provencensis]MBM6813742.1 helix-turn-helix transcriptional regulator [Olsenella uli]
MDNAEEKRAIGARIRAERTRCGISQRQLALMSGTSRSYLWKIETGTADVGIDVLIRIAKALDVPARSLIDC